MILLVLALLSRAVIPAGYMLAPSAAGLPTITFCSGAAPAVAPMAGHHRSSHHDQQLPPDQPCAFALMLSPAVPPEPPILLPMPLPAALPALALPASPAPGLAPHHLHPPATGPPASF